MIKQEKITINNVEFVKTYSEDGYYIKQVETNIEYVDAIDIAPLQYTYVETNKLIEEE